MSIQTALDEYNLALKQGQREYRELVMEGRSPYPAVLDDILPENNTDSVVDVGLVEIPSERIIGTKSAGRISAFTASFCPLLDSKSEFAVKWVNLCAAHLGETGITDPILCYEYLGNFYVQEGNKRVSVLRHFGSPRIPGTVKRIVPPLTDEPRIQAYYEFMDFYKASHLYCVQFRHPGDYARLWRIWGRKATKSGRNRNGAPSTPISTISGTRSAPCRCRRRKFSPRKRCCCGWICTRFRTWGSCPRRS